ncbi:MAG: preprotein translocase subunit YajC [Caulobacteraceae bacterium]
MFATPAFAQTAGAAAHGGGPQDMLLQFAPLVLIMVFGYFMLLRPQQQRAKAHAALIAGVKRGDTVVMSSGLLGKVTRVDDAEVEVEIAPTVNVKVVKSMITDVRAKGVPVVANDAPAAPTAKKTGWKLR